MKKILEILQGIALVIIANILYAMLRYGYKFKQWDNDERSDKHEYRKDRKQ